MSKIKIEFEGVLREVIPVFEFEWAEAGPKMYTLTCRNHPTCKYHTKNFYNRGLHFIQPAKEFLIEGSTTAGTECFCPASDMLVVLV